jgi:hypothetical protein
MKAEHLIFALGICAALVLSAAAVNAQGERGGANRTAASRPWPPQKLSDGQPDVQGVWAALNAGSTSLTNPISGGEDFDRRLSGKEIKRPSRIIDPPDGLLPYQPWAAARQKQEEKDYEHPSKPEHIDTQHRCLLSGIPRLYTIVPSYRIIQIPNAVVFVWDEYHAYRVIPLDARPHVASNVKLWMGDGRGHWEGNTLVIDTTNVRGARLTYIGDFHSENAHVTERLTFVDADNMTYEATVNDPTVFTRPWTMRIGHRRRPDEETWESACWEGNPNPDEVWLQKGK